MRITIDETPLKHFLRLFDPEEPIQVNELGDTMHPTSGFVDETILGEIKQVYQIIENKNNFDGLIYFQAIILGIQVNYQDQLYRLSEERQTIRKLVSKTRMMNSQPNWYPDLM